MNQDARKSQTKGRLWVYPQSHHLWLVSTLTCSIAAEYFTLGNNDFHPAENRAMSHVLQLGNINFEQVGNLPLKSDSVSQPVQVSQAENSTMLQESADYSKATSFVKSEVSCDFSLSLSNTCTINGDVRVSGISVTFLVPEFKSETPGGNNSKSWKLKPCARPKCHEPCQGVVHKICFWASAAPRVLRGPFCSSQYFL